MNNADYYIDVCPATIQAIFGNIKQTNLKINECINLFVTKSYTAYSTMHTAQCCQ